MPQPVHAVPLRLERDERIEEVGLGEAAVRPPREVGVEGREIVGVVRQQPGERGQLRTDRIGEVAGPVVLCGIRDAAVVRLQHPQGGHGGLEPPPRR